MSCPICLEKIKDEKITKCNHKFCKECLETWLNVNISCPICREKLPCPRCMHRKELDQEAVPGYWIINTNDYQNA